MVTVNTDDITTYKGCKSLLIASLTFGTIAGIFNLAAVLYDGILINQTPKRFADCVAPKASATVYLDELSRILCPHLEYFVIFSSASCGRGNAGQSNYGLANSIMERIIEQRVKQNLPGKAIQWGAVDDVGLVSEMLQNKMVNTEIAGTLPQRIASCLNTLDILITSNDAIVSSIVLSEKHFGYAGHEVKVTIISSILKIMGIRDLKSISPSSTLAELGMDSLMSVEIKQILEREFDIFLTTLELRMMTFAKFQEMSNNENQSHMHNKDKKEDNTGLNLMFSNFGDEINSWVDLLELETNFYFESSILNTSRALLIPG